MILVHGYELRDVAVTGRQIDMLVVPFDTPAWVVDEAGAYREVFAPGAFRHIDPTRVQLRYEHRDDLMHYLGKGVDLVDDGRALRGTMRVFRGDAGDHLLNLVADGELTGVSVGFVPGMDEDRVDADGPLVRRVKVKQLPEVSLTETPVYEQAKVTGLRSQQAARVETERARIAAFVANARAGR